MNRESGKKVPSKDLRRVNLKAEYNTEDDNIVRDLYRPCLKQATKYDRAVGYFRANIYKELGEDLLDFVIDGGKVRIVSSPDIPELDEQAARNGYSLRGVRSNEEREADLLQVMKTMSKNPKEADCLDMLRLLIEKGSLDLYVAVRKGGIYHRKVGMFSDPLDNKVVFSGSGNETSRAVSPLEDWCNDEDFDVYRSWGQEFEVKKTISKESHLNLLFAGGTERTRVRCINDVEREFLKKFRSNTTLEDCREGARERSISAENKEVLPKKNISLYSYQQEAVKAWREAGNVGMLSMATATGKTYTALFAVRDLLIQGCPILILVPSKVLIDIWSKSISEIYPEVPLLRAGGGYSWKSEANKRLFVSDMDQPRIILATMDTAASSDFIDFFKQAKNPVLIADEAHGLGSEVRRQILSLNFKAKLGLSATPERLFDEEGSRVLTDAFGKDPVYCLGIGDSVKLSSEEKKAVPILGHFLSRYEYYFYTVGLTGSEKSRWDDLTTRIKKIVAIEHSKKNKNNPGLGETLSLLLIRRSRIVKKAENKTKIVNQIIEERYPPNGRWIIYCEDQDQLNAVAKSIRSSFPSLVALNYHSKIASETRDMALSFFEQNPSVIISIRCLDEGADIPAADGAIILASSTNPRQYIQRRGRVLRTAKGKKYATIIDVIVLPESEDSEVPYSIVRGELARAWNFALNAQNRDISHKLWKICMEYGVDIEKDAKLSFEDSEG
jgi:superfamily II DNA or RNA helicase